MRWYGIIVGTIASFIFVVVVVLYVASIPNNREMAREEKEQNKRLRESIVSVDTTKYIIYVDGKEHIITVRKK